MIIDLKRLQKKQANRHSGTRRKAAPAPAPAPTPAPAPVPVVAPAPAPEPEKLSMMNTKAELTVAAEAVGVEVQSGWTKAQILAALYPGE